MGSTDVLGGLLARVAHGDVEAFADVYDQVAGAVYGLAGRIVGDESRAEQVAVEVLLEVWQSASRFSPAQGSGLSWVMTMARHRAMSQARAADGHPAEPAPAGASGASGSAAERVAGIRPEQRCLASLPEARRAAMVLACCGYA